MKKVLAAVLVVLTLVCVLSVAGCDKEEPTPNPTTTATTTVPYSTTTTTDPTTTDPFDPCPTTATTIPQTTPREHITGGNCWCSQVHGKHDDESDKAVVDPNNSANWKKVVKGVFTSDKGGLQMKAGGWKTYNLYSISMVPSEYNNEGVTNAICVAVYDADTADVFAAKTEEDFEAVLGSDVTSLESTTVCGYPAYYAVVPGQMYVYVINTPTYKYFINFMQAEGFPDIEPIGEQMMQGVTIFK